MLPLNRGRPNARTGRVGAHKHCGMFVHSARPNGTMPARRGVSPTRSPTARSTLRGFRVRHPSVDRLFDGAPDFRSVAALTIRLRGSCPDFFHLQALLRQRHSGKLRGAPRLRGPKLPVPLRARSSSEHAPFGETPSPSVQALQPFGQPRIRGGDSDRLHRIAELKEKDVFGVRCRISPGAVTPVLCIIRFRRAIFQGLLSRHWQVFRRLFLEPWQAFS